MSAATWQRRLFKKKKKKIPLRGAVELLVWGITICPCFSVAPNRPSNTKVFFVFFSKKDEMITS